MLPNLATQDAAARAPARHGAAPARLARKARMRPLLLLALLALPGCTGEVVGLRLPGGPTRGTMTYDEAMAARSDLTTLDRLPPREDAVRR